MAASDAKLSWSGDVIEVRSDDGRTFQTVYHEIWTVLIEATDHFSIASSAEGLPVVGEAASFNPFIRVTNKRARRASPIMAEVDISFSGPANGDSGDDPTNEPAEVHGSHQDQEIGFDRDAAGKRVCTITGEPYRGLQTVKADTVFTVTRALRRWSSAHSVRFANKVNAESFGRDNDHPAGTVLCKGFDWREIYSPNGSVYFIVTGRFIAREPDEGVEEDKTWYKRVLRQGLYCFVVKDNQYKVVRCVDSFGNPATSPMLLDSRGFQITPDDEGEFDEEEAADVWDYIQEFPSVSFAEIGFFN